MLLRLNNFRRLGFKSIAQLLSESNRCWDESFTRRIICVLLHVMVFMRWLVDIMGSSSVSDGRVRSETEEIRRRASRGVVALF